MNASEKDRDQRQLNIRFDEDVRSFVENCKSRRKSATRIVNHLIRRVMSGEIKVDWELDEFDPARGRIVGETRKDIRDTLPDELLLHFDNAVGYLRPEKGAKISYEKIRKLILEGARFPIAKP